MSVQAKASLSIRPRGGQVAVITLICFSAAFLFAAVWFHAQNQNFIIPLCGSIVFLLLGGSFWWVSHKNEELKSSHPFNLNLGEGHNGLALSADVRALPQLDYVKGLLSHYSSVFHREPLPMADGVISESGKPIVGSIEQANKVVLEANEQAREQCDLLMQDLLISASSPSSISLPVVSQLPPTIDTVASTPSN
ncbi:hypothetical protein [Pseudomonas sp. UBA4034]|uniref:hypothetical protein n=1 Tax=Pseudomonas sp. UBA4034 TaxID=1947315 RepID=UPI002579A8A3|nr:hypothetical protein [Pseudomonas sp. UBA4034]